MTIDELAASLRVSFRGPVAEADEWRPLAQYIVQLLNAQREACAGAAYTAMSLHPEPSSRSQFREAVIGAVEATPLVTDGEP